MTSVNNKTAYEKAYSLIPHLLRDSAIYDYDMSAILKLQLGFYRFPHDALQTTGKDNLAIEERIVLSLNVPQVIDFLKMLQEIKETRLGTMIKEACWTTGEIMFLWRSEEHKWYVRSKRGLHHPFGKTAPSTYDWTEFDMQHLKDVFFSLIEKAHSNTIDT